VRRVQNIDDVTNFSVLAYTAVCKLIGLGYINLIYKSFLC